MRADPHTWKKHLKRSLLLLAVPLLSVLFLSTGRDTTVGGLVQSWVRLPIHFSTVRTDHWFVRRAGGQYEVQSVRGKDHVPPEVRGLVMYFDRVRMDSRSGFWAPTRVDHIEKWDRATVSRKLSDESEYWTAFGNDQVAQAMLDQVIPRVPDRDPNLVEHRRYWDRREYAVKSVLATGYIHNAVVLLCAGAGFFEFGRAIRQRRRKRSAGLHKE